MNYTLGVPSTGYFIKLGYKNISESVIIAPNFKGLGLPMYLWD